MRNHGHTVFTKNHFFAMVSASKKNSAPTLASDKKSSARLAIYLKSENPAPDLSTKRATACWMIRPTITVGLTFYINRGGGWEGKHQPTNGRSIRRRQVESTLENKQSKD